MKPVKTIVLDAGPILQNNPNISTLLSKSEKLVTTTSVISEIRDPHARDRVSTTLVPFLTIRDPSPASIKFVRDFARRTGDLSVLSKTDIDILALAYELDCEQNGGDGRLRRVPGQKETNAKLQEQTDESNVQSSSASPQVPNVSKNVDDQHEVQEAEAVSESQEASEVCQALETPEISQDVDKSHKSQIDPSTLMQDLELEERKESRIDETIDVVPDQGEENHPVSVEKEDEDDSGSDGWITPSNIKEHQAKDSNAAVVPGKPEIAMEVVTLTVDYAMQNILLQIGLYLISPTVQRVRNIRNYILRCHACFEKVKDTSKQFCPRCGKPTLTRVTCSTNANGQFQIHLKKNMQWNHRGDRYSIPKPVSGSASGKVAASAGGGKGGWGRSLLLAEDQKEYQRAMNQSNKKNKGRDLMDEDYLPSILTGERRSGGQRPKVGAGRNVNSKRRT